LLLQSPSPMRVLQKIPSGLLSRSFACYWHACLSFFEKGFSKKFQNIQHAHGDIPSEVIPSCSL